MTYRTQVDRGLLGESATPVDCSGDDDDLGGRDQSPLTRGGARFVRAYVDESVRVAAPGLYVLTGVVVRSEQAEPVRDVLRSELRHQRRPFH
jgi:hypothetical protein